MSNVVHANIDATIASIDGEPVRHVDSDEALCGAPGVNTPECAILDECAHMPVVEWRAHHVSAWLTHEIGVEHERQRRTIHDNVKSGKVLLALTNADLQTTIGIGHPLMVRKVRAAIDELRADKVCVTTRALTDYTYVLCSKYPHLREITTDYVVDRFLADCGLRGLYATAFRRLQVNGRLLDTLTRKQLDKYFGMSNKTHQSSLITGVQLLRRFDYDIKALEARRAACERFNADMLVWTHGRLLRWLQCIDMSEQAAAAAESGVSSAQ